VLVVVAAFASMTASAGANSRALSLGFFDPVYMQEPDVAAPWLQRTVDAGSDVVKLDIGWVAATRPADARDPADPAYDFSGADRGVRAASARGLQVVLSFVHAPAWAEGPDRPADAPAGTWRPDPAAIGDYGAALARRYSGSYPDPDVPGAMLPRVKALQVWNEPNFALYLTPQWSGRTPVSPAIYRAMLNAFYDGVKSADAAAVVVTAGTGPFGDPQRGGARMAPALFWRGVLCQRQVRGRLRPARCSDPAHFDVFAHHPYPSGSPRWKENYADDVSISGVYKLTRILRAAQRSRRALPRIDHPVWVTEVSYDSAAPDPNGVPLPQHARYLQQTLYLLWRQGVSLITWYRIQDEAPVPSYGDTNQSGLYYLDGAVKPAARAFRFPFVAERAGGGMLRAWGRSPVAGRVKVERRRRGHWIALRSTRVSAHGTFLLAIPAIEGTDRLRASVGSERSLVWQLG
jgi:hypothetical protein